MEAFKLIISSMSNLAHPRHRTDSWSSQHTENEMISTNRDHTKVGQPAVYIVPKEFSENEPDHEQEDSNESGLGSVGHLQDSVCSSSHIKKSIKSLEKSKKKIIGFADPELPERHLKSPSFIYRRVQSRALLLVEALIFLGFLVCSYPTPQQFGIVDLAVNGFCLLKILCFHTWLYIYNSHKQKEKSSRNLNNLGSTQMLINRLEKYEMLQIWSIIITPLIYVFAGTSFVNQMLTALQAIRLLFPLLIQYRSAMGLRVNVFFHIVKLTLFSGLFLLVISTSMTLIFGNVSTYYCMKSQELILLTQGQLSGPVSWQQCGSSKKCEGSGTSCRNAFELAQSMGQIYQIRQTIGLNEQYQGFDGSILNGFLATSSIGVGLYNKYSSLLFAPIVVVLVLAMWLVSTLIPGVCIGQALRSETVENWELSEKASRKKQSNINQLKRRSSNIGFSWENIKYEAESCRSKKDYEENSEEPQQGLDTFSKDLLRIQGQITQRPLGAKIFTFVFNLISLLYVVLIVLDGVDLAGGKDKIINIVLLVLLILWALGVLIGGVQFCRSKEDSPLKKFVLGYQIVALAVTFADYAARIKTRGQFITSTSFLTPLSHTIISLRVLYVIFNNGLSAICSYFMEKMIVNACRNARFISTITLMATVVGFIHANIVSGDSVETATGRVNNSISMIFGTGGAMEQSIGSKFIFGILKLLGFVAGIYIAKNYNLGYDSILNIDLSENVELTPEVPDEPRQLPSLGLFQKEHCFRSVCSKTQYSEYYRYFKTAIVLSYTILSIAYNGPLGEGVPSAVLFSLDVYFLCDLLMQIVAFGLWGEGSYLHSLPIKIAYIITQFYLPITFFIPKHTSEPIAILMRVSRVWMIFFTLQKLQQTLCTIRKILFHPKLKIYCLVLLGLPLILFGMGLTARFSVNQQGVQAYNVFVNAISFVYGLGGNFGPDTKQYAFSSVALNLAFISVILFFHVMVTFLMVTYFVNKQVGEMGDVGKQIYDKFSSTDPDHYDYVVSTDRSLAAYLSSVKLFLLFASLLCTALLAGNNLVNPNCRLVVAVINLCLVLGELSIYIVENTLIRTRGEQKWPFWEGLFLILAMPGSFLLVAPTIKYSSTGIGLALILRIFLLLSPIHLFNIFSLITQRVGGFWTSRIWRRIFSGVPYQEFLLISLAMLLLLLPFAACISRENSTNFFEQLLATLTGAYFRNPTVSVFQLLVKAVAISCIFLPLKIMMIARVISSFLNNNLNSVVCLESQIDQAICDCGLLDSNEQSLHVLHNNYFKITKKLLNIFHPYSKLSLNVSDYKSVTRIFKLLNIPVLCFESQGKSRKRETIKVYGVFVYDIVMGVHRYAELAKQRELAPLDSLYQHSTSSQPNVSKIPAPITSKTLTVLSHSKARLMELLHQATRRRKNAAYMNIWNDKVAQK